jgi:hypothetical protein
MRLLALLAVLATAALFASGAGAGSTASCSVSPDPIQSLPYPLDYYTTVTLTGADAGVTYYVWVSQPHNNQITQQHPETFLTTDSTGTGSTQINGNDPNHVLQPGTVNVKLTVWPSGAKVASCSFTVT